MKILSILLARIVALAPLEELNPRGQLLGPHATQALVEKCGFMAYPQKVEDYLDTDKGIKYEVGRWGDFIIQQLTVYPGGIALDTNTSTRDSEKIVNELLEWAKETLGLEYEPGLIKHRVYRSELVFRMEASLNALNPKLAGIADKITESVADNLDFVFPYEVNAVVFGFDTTHVRPNAGKLTIERREGIPYSENKYYSTAPIHTDEHIALLEELESGLKS